MTRRAAAAIVLVLLVAAAVGIEVARDGLYGEPSPAETILYVRSGDFLRRTSLSNASLLADIYWIRAIQYYGGTRLSKNVNKTYDLLYPLLDIVTALDPHFTVAYRFGAVFLSERYPGGAGSTEQAIALLRKGLRADPLKWQYYLDLGFVYYWSLHDYRSAADAFNRGANVPGGPVWMRQLAAVTLATGGDRAGSRVLWQQLKETGDNAWIRNSAELKLMQLDALDQIDELQRTLFRFWARSHVIPGAWDTLVRAGWLRGVPLDPTGVPYVLDPPTGHVTVSPESKLHPLPTEAGAPGLEPPSNPKQ